MAADRLTWAQVLSRWRGENVAYAIEPYRAVAREVRERAAPHREAKDAELARAAGLLAERARQASARAREVSARAAELPPGAAARTNAEPLAELDELVVPTFALVFEAARRALGLEAFEEQLVAALVLARGKVAELATGEGKTLAAVFAATLAALAGRGVHVLTTNDYLARRDAAWMGPVYERLGLEVGLLQAGTGPADRKRAYAAPVTYGTLGEVGFDLLRDGLAREPGALVQVRALDSAILDDLDSTLIDEARHPLVLAGEVSEDEGDGGRADELVRALRAGVDYEVDEHGERAFLTERGTARVEEALGRGDLYDPENLELLTRVNLAVHAHAVLRREVDYLVRRGRIELIDQQRGRVAEGRRLPDGIHAALEDKEGLPRSAASRVLGQTTLQSVARLYRRLAGTTATARTAAEELGALYRLEVVVIPPHRPCVRKDFVDLVFTHGEARDAAVQDEVEEAHRAGRPVLVGTDSVEASEALAAALAGRGVPSRVLNARNDEAEAEVVAAAGAPGAVTISTAMAGRGTDIRLGGPDEAERDRVVAAGGLSVIGTRRSESERVDDQLRGRAGRQGDPGSSQLFVSLEDDLFVRYGVTELLPPNVRGLRSDEPLLDRRVLKELDRAQRIIAGRSSAIRKTLWGYDGFVERQRRTVWRRRRLALLGRGESLLAEVAPESFAAAVERLGEGALARLERALTLGWIDRGWADHLARLAEVREQVQLMSSGVAFAGRFGRERPMDTFHRLARESFEAFEQEVDEGIVESLERAVAAGGELDLEAEGLAPPARTWTFVVTEQPLDTRPPPRFQVTLARKLARWLGGRAKG